MNKKEKIQLIKKLKPFWKKYRKISFKFSKEGRKIEKEINNKIKPKVELGFFCVDGKCCGIGALDYIDRKKFPLIHDGELEE